MSPLRPEGDRFLQGGFYGQAALRLVNLSRGSGRGVPLRLRGRPCLSGGRGGGSWLAFRSCVRHTTFLSLPLARIRRSRRGGACCTSAVVSTADACFPSHSLHSICSPRRLAAGVAWMMSAVAFLCHP